MGEECSNMTDKGLQDTLNTIVGMIDELGKKTDELGKKVDKLDQRMDSLEQRMDTLEQKVDHMQRELDVVKQDVAEIKAEQKSTNDRLDILSSMYGEHEIAIRQLKAKKII